MSTIQSAENINNSYFDGYYKEIWRAIIPDELTLKELDFMLQYFGLKPGDKVLDMMCGYGRHAIGLARKGITVTAVDNLPDYIAEIKQTAKQENLPVDAVKADIMQYDADDSFDLVICMGNSLNFFGAEEMQHLLSNISSHLKQGGHFLINSWSIAEIAMKNFKERSWSETKGIKFLTDSKFLFQPTRIETESIIIAPDGRSETKTAIDYIFSIAEMEAMLNKAGLILKEVYSIPGKKKFTLGEPRAYIIAEKG
jgi:2-polyprenyl-3-methyl-5-hydroxy-6-metoxy-1,4-benzoquinol methylase